MDRDVVAAMNLSMKGLAKFASSRGFAGEAMKGNPMMAKLKSLIVKSAEAKEQSKREYNIEIQLGKRADYLTIISEKDCTSVKLKSWIAKPVWREINDILFINGFHWIENGADSKWIKLRE